MANIGSIGILEHIDDPMITVIGDAGDSVSNMAGYTWVSDSAGSHADFIRAVAAGKGLHYIGVMAASDDNVVLEFASSGLYFTAQEGHCAVEILIQFEAASGHAFTFGFNSAVEGGVLPVDFSAATTLTKASSDFCGFVYDGTDATYPDLHCVWVDDSSIGQSDSDGRVDGQTIRMRSMSPTSAKWLYMKVELQDRGSGNGARATFLAVDHNGYSVERTFNTSLDRDVPLCYHLGVENRSSAGGDVFIRHNNWSQSIPNM